MIHEIKLRDEFADAVLNGEKTFEIRVNDRGYQKGDKVVFHVLSDGVPIPHPIENHVYEITYVLTGWGIKESWCVFSIKDSKEERKEE